MPREREAPPERHDPDKPLGPANVFVTTPFLAGVLDIRWDDPSILTHNLSFTLVGVNVYRAQTESGPYTKINTTPISTFSYRDQSTQQQIVREDVSNRFVERGNGRTGEWWFCTNQTPIVVPGSPRAEVTSNPRDVKVYVDGTQVQIKKVLGQTGEVWLHAVPVIDFATGGEKLPTLPTPTSTVEVTYSIPTFTLELALQRHVFYKVTAVDAGGNETPLDQVKPHTHENVEQLGYIWREAMRRNYWILEQGGERVLAFVRKTMGPVCLECFPDPRVRETHKQPRNDCLSCYGTGMVGGYIGPIPIILAPKQEKREILETNFGMKLANVWTTWTTNFPLLRQRDFFRTQMGEIFVIGPVSRIESRGLILQQMFDVGLIDTTDIRYRVPVDNYVPLITDKPTVEDAIELRGRTLTFENIHY